LAEQAKAKPTGDAGAEKPSDATETHRFYIALAIILGMVIIIFVPTAQASYSSAKDLAAIFSGWITAVVGFYFLQQSTERAQQQTQQATTESANARKDAASAAKKLTSLTGAYDSALDSFRETVEKHKKRTLEYGTATGAETKALGAEGKARVEELNKALSELSSETEQKLAKARDTRDRILAEE
jgi:uncharacterized protein HemX